MNIEKVKIENMPFGPFPVVLVGADVNGKPSYTTIGACGVVSMKPVLYVSLRNTHYINSGIKETGFFSVNIPSSDMVQNTDYCGVVSGKTVDKSKVFTPFYDDLGKAPLISECSLNFLCKVINMTPIFDFEFFLGEIVATYANKQCLVNGKLDPQKVNPLLLMGPTYWNLSHQVGRVYKEGSRLISDTAGQIKHSETHQTT